MEYIFDGLDEGAQVPKPNLGIPQTTLNLISQFCIIFDAILPAAEEPHDDDVVHCCFIEVNSNQSYSAKIIKLNNVLEPIQILRSINYLLRTTAI